MSLNGECCDWEWGYRYTREYRRFSGPVFAAAEAVCVAAVFAAQMWCALPLCRGDLTVAEFARNYNHFHHILAEDSGAPVLDKEGRWSRVEPEPEPGTVVIDLFGGGTVYDEPGFTLSDGRVTAVTLHMESSANIVSTGTREYLALLALSGSVDGLNLFNLDSKGWVQAANETVGRWEDVELDYRGLHISQRVAYTGYDVGSWSMGTLHAPSEGEKAPRHCEKTVTISLIE